MLQVLQHVKTGKLEIEDLPGPILREGCVLVENRFSVLSSGTEKSIIESTRKSLINKASKQPEAVKSLLSNTFKNGPANTYRLIMSKLDKYKELGYSCAGTVKESSIKEFKVGDSVACAGTSATHSEEVVIPKNLCVKIPDNVSFEEAAFTTIGSIAMQGVRQANLRVGENVCVIGLGLIGLITVQILKSSGINVFGVDINSSNFEIAHSLGIDETGLIDFDSIRKIEVFTKGTGTDSVIITAGTQSNDPMEYALKYARKKSNIVIVGAIGMNIPRSPFYEKELEIKISCSYGPGRYDDEYEKKGNDYPIGYVRWTENRNMESFLKLVSDGKINLKSLITHKFNISDALKGYDLITGKLEKKYLGVILEYNEKVKNSDTIIKLNKNYVQKLSSKVPVIGFIGAGDFAQAIILPNLKNYRLKTLVNGQPHNSKLAAKKYNFENASTNNDDIFNDKDIDTVFIATRHDIHYENIIKGIASGKNIFVEKPLAINLLQLNEIKDRYENSKKDILLLTGFNRRFSKVFEDIKDYFKYNKEPYIINYRINAGFIPKEHWTQEEKHGGRIIGEICHFIDTLQYITNSIPKSVYAKCISLNNMKQNDYDTVSIIIGFSDGSVGNINYLANGYKSVPKEYCEIHSAGKSVIMDNFANSYFYTGTSKKIIKYDGNKGHKREIEHFFNVINGKEALNIPFNSQFFTTLTTFKIIESLSSGKAVDI